MKLCFKRLLVKKGHSNKSVEVNSNRVGGTLCFLDSGTFLMEGNQETCSRSTVLFRLQLGCKSSVFDLQFAYLVSILYKSNLQASCIHSLSFISSKVRQNREEKLKNNLLKLCFQTISSKVGYRWAEQGREAESNCSFKHWFPFDLVEKMPLNLFGLF